MGSLGIIGGGALLFAASGLVGQAFIAPAIGGIGKLTNILNQKQM